MNPHVLQGTIAFVLWSTFASWYYVNNIKEQPDNLPIEVPEEVIIEPVVPSTIEDSANTVELEPVRVELQTMLYFELNSSDVLNKTELNQFIDSIKSLPTSDDYVLKIVGYTCDLGSVEYNDSLSKVRASTVADVVLPILNDKTDIDVLGLGEQNPVMANTSEESRSKNRRVELKITN